MEEYERNIIPHIEAIYETFTELEKNIADYFIHYDGKEDLVSKKVGVLTCRIVTCVAMGKSAGGGVFLGQGAWDSYV